jgi:hypothetical protein
VGAANYFALPSSLPDVFIEPTTGGMRALGGEAADFPIRASPVSSEPWDIAAGVVWHQSGWLPELIP